MDWTEVIAFLSMVVLVTVFLALMMWYFGRQPATFREPLLWYLPAGEYTRDQRLTQLRTATWGDLRPWLYCTSGILLGVGIVVVLITSLADVWQRQLSLSYVTLRVVIPWSLASLVTTLIWDSWLVMFWYGRYSSARRRIELDTAADTPYGTRRYPAISALDKEHTMYVTRLDADNWTAGSQQDEVVERPELAQIEQVLGLLDGEQRTLVVLGANDTTYMGIGGGSDGRFVVFINYNDEEFYSLKNSDPAISEDEAFSLTIGGRSDEYPASQCIGREEMLRAALCFATDGSREPSLTWELQEEDEEEEEWVLQEGDADDDADGDADGDAE